MWDEMADTYPLDFTRASISKAVSIAERMEERRTALDIGCGPGNMTIPMAGLFEEVTAADSSPRMLDRLERECRDRSIGNVRTVITDCMDLEPGVRYNLVLTCLCPGMYSEKAADLMTSLSCGRCVYIGPTYKEKAGVRGILEDLGFEMHPFFETEDLVRHLSEGYDVEITGLTEPHNYPDRQSIIDRCVRMAHADEEGARRISEHVMDMPEKELPRDRKLLCLEWSPE